jgi:hypothetical protein
MTLSFENTEEDAANTLSYMNLQSPKFVKNARGLKWAGFLMLFISLIMIPFSIYYFSPLALLLFSFYLLIAYIFINQKKIIQNNCKALVKSGAAATLIGPQEFSLTPQGIKHKSNFFDGTYSWSGIKEIIETEEHIAFHFSTMQAFLIPKRAFASSEQKQIFLKLVEQYRQAPTGVQTPQTTRGGWWTQGSSVTDETQANQSRF